MTHTHGYTHTHKPGESGGSGKVVKADAPRVTGDLHRAGNRVGSAFIVSDKLWGGGGGGKGQQQWPPQ